MSGWTAGHELDEVVAVEVMGWVEVEATDVVGQRSGIEPGTDYFRRVPEFSTEMAAVWRVVEKMATLTPDPWMLTLKNWNYYGNRTWTAEFTSHPLGPPRVEAQAETAPLAICRAALQAVKVPT